ncbi:hypothetical protein FQZ97_966630 [compost metagenome]
MPSEVAVAPTMLSTGGESGVSGSAAVLGAAATGAAPAPIAAATSAWAAPGRSRPIMWRASSATGVSLGLTRETTRPPRITVARCDTAVISARLWLIRITEHSSCSTRPRSMVKRERDSCRVSTAVGSSRTSRRGRSIRHVTSSTRCCSPTLRSPTIARGETSRPKRSLTSSICAIVRSRSTRPSELRTTFSQTDSVGMRL